MKHHRRANAQRNANGFDEVRHRKPVKKFHPLELFAGVFSKDWKIAFLSVLSTLLFGGITAFGQYSGNLFGPANVDNGATDGNLNSPSTQSATQNGNIRYQWRVNGSGNGTAWVGFEWDSRTRQFSFYGNPTFSPNNDVIIRGDMDIGGSAYGWGAIGNFGVGSVENTKTYIFNITDNGSTLATAAGNDQINLAITEINHQSTLVNSPDGNNTGLSTTISGNNFVLGVSNSAENSGSNEELWFQWTKDNFSTKNFIQITSIGANQSISIPASSFSPGDTLKWLVALTGPSATGTVSSTTSGLGNFDVIAINKSTLVEYTIPSLPGAPTITSITPGNQQLSIAFTAASGTSITNYQYSTDNGSTWKSAGSTASPLVITTVSGSSSSLANGTTYAVRIRAQNLMGAGTQSDSSTGTPRTTPGAPTITGITPGSGQLSVAFTAGSDGGSSITNYQYSTNDGSTWTLRSPVSTASPIVISGLNNGTTYTVRIRALNAAGEGTQSGSSTGTPRTTPTVASTPTSSTVATNTATLGGEVTATGGASITERGIYWSTTSGFANGTGTKNSETGSFGTGSFTRSVTGLPAGTTVYFKSFAVNAAGTTYSSQGSILMAPAKPATPTASGVGTESFTANWTATTGAASYRLDAATDSGFTAYVSGYQNLTVSSTSQAISGLTAGTTYYVRIRAVNATATSANSDTLNQATVSSTPTISSSGTPGALSTTYGTASSSTSFTVSGSDMTEGILVTPPPGFEVSLDDSSFNSTVTAGAAGAIASTTVYLRLAATATPGSKSGNIVLSSGGASDVNVATTASTVNTKNLTVTGASAANKVYDRTAAASISGASLSGIVGSDTVTLANATTGTFAQAGVGTSVSVTSFMTLSGADASYYTLNTQPTLSANITQKELTVSGASVTTKTYDRTTAAAITGASLSGVISGDTVTLGNATTGTFVNATVGSGKSVTSFMTISGASAANYSISQPTLTGTISAKSVTVTGASAANKTYDTTTAATISGSSLSGVISPDVVTLANNTTGTFAQATVGTGISVTSFMTITGADSGNYTLAGQPTLTADITKANQAAVSGSYGSSTITLGNTTTVSASGGSGTGAYQFRTNASSTATFSLSGSGSSRTVNPTSSGSIIIEVSRAADANYNEATWVSAGTLTVNAIGLPSAGTATVDGKEMVRLSWTKNTYDVLVLYKQGSAPTAPVGGQAYAAGDTVGGDSNTKVLYKGGTDNSDFQHVVASGQTHYYAFYSENFNYYSAAISTNVSTDAYDASDITETFSYTNGVSLGTLNGGTGWANAWSVGGGTWTINSGMTAGSGYPQASGFAVKLANPGTDGSGSATRGITGISTGTIYISTIIRYGFDGANKWAGIDLSSNGNTVAYFGKDYTQSFRFGIESGGSRNYDASYDFNPGDGGNGSSTNNQYLIIARYNFATDTFNGKVYYKTDSVPATEPTSWNATLSSVNIGSIDGIKLSAGAGSGGQIGDVYYDEIRVGQSWGELTGLGPPPAMTNYTVNSSNPVTDGQITGGTYTVTMKFFDNSGMVSDSTFPNFDVVRSDGTVVVTNQTFGTKTYTGTGSNKGKYLTATSTAQASVAPGGVTLGTYYLRWTAKNSNDTVVTDSATLSNGDSTYFTVIDDDNAGPEIGNFNVSGQTYYSGDVSSGLLITGMVVDAISGVYGGATNRFILYRDGNPVYTNSFTTRPANNGDARP